MKRFAIFAGTVASMVGSAFADIAVGPDPSDFIPVTSSDPATAMFVIAAPVAILIVAAVILLWYLRSHKK